MDPGKERGRKEEEHRHDSLISPEKYTIMPLFGPRLRRNLKPITHCTWLLPLINCTASKPIHSFILGRSETMAPHQISVQATAVITGSALSGKQLQF
jgi:hypothetical protein